MKKIIFLAITIILSSGCISTKRFKDFSGNKLIFGSGGGFTGITSEYVLQFNGTIEKGNSLTGEAAQIKQISKQQSKKLFQKYLENGFDTLEFSVPGNMSYFIGHKNDSLLKKITWGGDREPPLEAKNIYNSLIQLINNQ